VNEWRGSVVAGSQVTLVERSSANAFANGEFLVSFTGQWPQSYQFKYVSSGPIELMGLYD
jgi:hypothetical protein